VTRTRAFVKRLRLKLTDEYGNASLNAGVVERLLAQVEHKDRAAYITIEGTAASFCDGMGLYEAAQRTPEPTTWIDGFADLLRAIETTPCPVIALVGGRVLGGGVGLVAASDIVIATPDATFGLPELLFGLVPATVLPVVARRIGLTRARWLAVSAQVVAADEAWRLGLVDEVGDLEPTLAKYVRRIEKLDARAVGELKAMTTVLHDTPENYQADSISRFRRLAASAETRDRISRYLAGHSPWPDTADS
jgi:polyketide biosynthesis enoyl-CoA hydratase PksH